MRWWSRPSRPVLAVLAVAFSASLLAYTGLWFVVASPEPKVELSFDNTYLPSEHAQLIDAVHKNSPAEKAGLRPADRIVAIDGQPIADESVMRNSWLRHQPGDQIRLTIVRPSASSPVFLTATFRPSPSESPGGLLGRQLSNWFPAPFVLVGLAVLFLRLEDPNAWLLVLVFGGLIVTRGLPPTSPHPAWWPFAMAYQALLLGMLGPLFYWFFAVFPRPLFLLFFCGVSGALAHRSPPALAEVEFPGDRLRPDVGRHPRRCATPSASLATIGGRQGLRQDRFPDRLCLLDARLGLVRHEFLHHARP